MRTVIFGALAYAAVFAIVTFFLAMVGASEHLRSGSGPADNWATAAIIVFGVGICSSSAFAFVTACSPAWHRRQFRFVMWIGIAMALLAFVFQLVGVGALLSAMLIPTSIIRVAPKLSGLLAFAVPGVLGGLIAIGLARRNERSAGKVPTREEN